MTENEDDGDGDEGPAGIAYHGVAGSSGDCETAVLRLLATGAPIVATLVLTSGRRHTLLLTTDIGDQIAIKSGFTSGYGGTSPAAFSRVLQFLVRPGSSVDEQTVEAA